MEHIFENRDGRSGMPDLDFVPGDRAISYLRRMSNYKSSFGECTGFMAHNMISSFMVGATLREVVDETLQAIREEPGDDFQKIGLYAVNDLVNGVLKAESLIGKEESFDFSGVRTKVAKLDLKEDGKDVSSDMPVVLDLSGVSKKTGRDDRSM